jgi:hypothetical protein
MAINPAPVKNKVDIPSREGISSPWRKWHTLLSTSVNNSVGKVSGATAGNIAILTAAGGLEDSGKHWRKLVSVTYTSSRTLRSSDFGKVIKVNNGIENVKLSLPSVGASDVDYYLTVCRLGTGQVEIAAADSDTIEKSSAGGSILCNEPGRVVANVTLYLATETKWAILAATGLWQLT